MELTEAIRRRHMVRSFSDRSVDPALLDELVADALRAPSAGNARGTAWLLLEGSERTAVYWAHTTTEEWRQRSRRWEGLSRAPVAALSLASPAEYVARYGEDDKAASGLGPGPAQGEAAWPVPYWFGDAAFATMALLLRATEAGLGACFLGSFRGEEAVLSALGVPLDWRLFGTVLLGYPDGADHRSPSLSRPGASAVTRVHRGRW
jgi:nitroreductase